MTEPATPYRGAQFGSGYSAEFLPPGQSIWRYVKQDKKIAVFSTYEAARRAAERAYWSDPKAKRAMGSDLDEEALAEKLTRKAEDWLRVNRAPPVVMRQPGKKAVIVFKGRARA